MGKGTEIIGCARDGDRLPLVQGNLTEVVLSRGANVRRDLILPGVGGGVPVRDGVGDQLLVRLPALTLFLPRVRGDLALLLPFGAGVVVLAGRVFTGWEAVPGRCPLPALPLLLDVAGTVPVRLPLVDLTLRGPVLGLARLLDGRGAVAGELFVDVVAVLPAGALVLTGSPGALRAWRGGGLL